MATGQDQLTREMYEKSIKDKPDRELLIEVAMGLYDMKDNCARACNPPTSGQQRAYNYTGVLAFVIAVYETVKTMVSH